MFCALIGLIPPDPQIAEHVRSQVTTVDDSPIDWREGYGLAPDEDHDDDETLLMTACTEASSENLLEEVKKIAQQVNADVHCEIWATAPAPLPLCPLEGYNPHIGGMSPEAMKKWGIVLQKQVLNAEGIQKFRQIVDAAILKIDRALEQNQPHLQVGQDAFCFREIASRNKERFDLRLTCSEDLQLVHELILNDDNTLQFLSNMFECANKDSLLEEIDFDLSVVYSRPGACAQGWHADGNHIPGALESGWKDDGWETHLANPYAICLFVPLINLNERVGYTQFWPGSHQHRSLNGFGPVANVTKSVWNGSCNAGDGIWYDYRLLHQGMPNTSEDVLRPVIQVVFKKKWYVEKANYGVQSLYEKEDSTNEVIEVHSD